MPGWPFSCPRHAAAHERVRRLPNPPLIDQGGFAAPCLRAALARRPRKGHKVSPEDGSFHARGWGTDARRRGRPLCHVKPK